MAEFINTIDVLGDDGLFDALVENTLEEFSDNVITMLGWSVLGYQPNLKKVNVPNVTVIWNHCFYNSASLTALILSSSTICTLSNTQALTGTPIKSGTGYIYVPRALVDSYKTATNWSTYAAQFRALEDYTVDGTTTGDLDETKI